MWKPLIKQVHTHLTWFQRSVLKGNVPFCGVLFWPCLILYFNKEKDCLWWKESWDLNLELTVFSPFLPLPGGQQLVLWLTAAPPSVCRPLTYWVDKHPRASGVLPTWPCTCLHIAQCLCGRRTGQSSLAQQALPSCPVEGGGGGLQNSLEMSWLSFRAELPSPFPPSWNISSPKWRTLCLLCFSFHVSVSHTQTI